VLGGKALLPADYLAAMHPWNSAQPSDHLPQWNALMWDGIAQFYPWRIHYARSMASGEIPFWNPHQFCGTPFVANAQTAVFYPFNLLFVLFPPVYAFGISAMLHLFLAGAFTFLLARTLGIGQLGATVAGVVFEFSAFMVVWLELPTLINVATWLPLILYLILMAMDGTKLIYAILAGMTLGISILAGHFQIASYVVCAAVLWWIWLIASRARVDWQESIKKGTIIGLICFAVAFMIAAPQILPTLELAKMSHRVRDVSAAGYTTYLSNSVPVRNLITLFVPNFYGNPSTNSYIDYGGNGAQFIEYAIYIGLLPFLLALIGAVFTIRWRTVGYFAMLAVLSLLFAFGTPLNYITYHIIPGTSALGGPNRVIVLFCFAAAILAGFGAHWFAQLAQEEYAATKRNQGWRALSISAAMFIIVLIAAQYLATSSLSSMGVDSSAVMSAAYYQYISFGALLIAGLVVLALYTAKYLPKPLFGVLAIAVIVADLFSFGMGFNPVSPPEQVYPNTPLTNWIKNNAGSTRIMPINNKWSLYNIRALNSIALPPNAATVYGFYDMQGYDSLFSKQYKQFIDTQLQMDSCPPENGNMMFIKSYVDGWPKGTAGYVIATEPIAGLTKTYDSDGVHIYAMSNQNDYQQAYLLPERNGIPKGSAFIAEQDTNKVIVTADTDQPAKLVLAEAWYPGWHANIDGLDLPVSVSQGIFRTADIEPGNSTVSFTFRPGTIVAGMFLGLLGISVVGAATGMVIVRAKQ
jgi:hypothetical protein